jgi:hypothetical protein
MVISVGEIWSNFDLKNMISTYTQDLYKEKGPNSPDFERKKVFKLSNFYDKF